VRTLAAGPRQRGDGRGGRGRYLAGTDLGVGLEPLEDTLIFLQCIYAQWTRSERWFPLWGGTAPILSVERVVIVICCCR